MKLILKNKLEDKKNNLAHSFTLVHIYMHTFFLREYMHKLNKFHHKY